MLAQKYQRLRSLFGTGPLFPRQRATPKINLNVGYLAVVTPILSFIFLPTVYLHVTNWIPAETTEF